ncbi:MAG: gamma-glutamylcyclotransferase [Kangiellaceae bacterium]|nr:gamma-glutamylcyclotransferase [Kangiellaceae bacterium]
MENLFVYGTLGPGRPNEHILKAIGGSWQDASVRGVLKEEGWGAEMGFPGIILEPTGYEIKGFVFSSENLSAHWEELDQFEGEAYARVLTSVALIDGRFTGAFVYTLRT